MRLVTLRSPNTFAFFLMTLACTVAGLTAARAQNSNGPTPVKTSAGRPWKEEVEIIADHNYQVSVFQAMDALACDPKGRLWLRVQIAFPDEQNKTTDFYYPRVILREMVSDDMGRTWRFTDEPRPLPPDTRSTLTNGTIIETGSHCWLGDRWERYPRAMIPELRRQGYYVKDMGEKEDYCAIIYDIWMRRSTDGGRTWKTRPLHTQLPFFAELVEHKYQRLLADGTILVFCYGAPGVPDPEIKHADVNSGQRTTRNAYVLRSPDGGDSWQLVMMADGRAAAGGYAGFSEPYPMVWPDGRIMTLLRSGLGQPAYLVRSTDGGKTWSRPEKTPIISKHPTVTRLSDGAVVCTYPRRFARPYGIRARFTTDMGQTWSDEAVLADNFEIEDGLAFPLTVELPDGTLFTAMHGKRYVEERKVQNFVFGARWTRDYRRTYVPQLKPVERLPKFNADRKNQSPWERAAATGHP